MVNVSDGNVVPQQVARGPAGEGGGTTWGIHSGVAQNNRGASQFLHEYVIGRHGGAVAASNRCEIIN